jgi:hypothetical protein
MKITEEMKKAVLAAVSVDELNKVAQERSRELLQPLIDDYTAKEKELAEIRGNINAIAENWHPPTLAEKITAWVSEQKTAPTLKLITDQFKAEYRFGIANTVKKMVDKKTLTLTGDKYSVAK